MNKYLSIKSFTQVKKHRNASAFHSTFSPKVLSICYLGRSSDLLYLVGLPIKKTVTIGVTRLIRAYSCGNSLGLTPNSLLRLNRKGITTKAWVKVS